MTNDKLNKLNALDNDIKELTRILDNVNMLKRLNVHCDPGFSVNGSAFKHSEVVINLCTKFKGIVEEELQRLQKEFEEA